jgi:hypothetical protein
VRWIFEKRVAERWSYYRIADELTALGVLPGRGPNTRWHDNTINRMLTNPIYKGTVHWGGIHIDQGQHEPIVTPELWQAAQDIPATREHRTDRPVFPLTGLVVCKACGYAMSYTVAVRESRHRLRCSNFSRSHGQRCSCNSVYASRLEQFVYERVCEVLDDPDTFLESQRQISDSDAVADELADINRQLNALQARFERWNNAYEMGSINIDELQGHRARIGAQAGKLQQRRIKLQQSEERDRNCQQTLASLTPLLSTLASTTAPELNLIYKRLIRHVRFLRGEDPDIVWL